MRPDLSTSFGGLRLTNPVIAASTEYTMTESGIRACIDAGAGAVVAKSINESADAARQLDIADYTLLDERLRTCPWGYAPRSATLFNRSGLAQAPVQDWLALLARCQRYATAHGSIVIGSITVASIEGAAELAAAMAGVVPAIEVNIGAPHGREGKAVEQVTDPDSVAQYTRAVRDAVSCPLIIKLPGQASDIVGMAQAAADSGADVVAMIGRLNGFVPSLESWQPALGSWGAVGGSWMLPVSLYWVSKGYRALSVPLIGTNGARTGLDVARFLLSGARAVELGSLLLMCGARVISAVLAELEAYLKQHHVHHLAEIVGAATDRAKEYAELSPATPRPQPWLDV